MTAGGAGGGPTLARAVEPSGACDSDGNFVTPEVSDIASGHALALDAITVMEGGPERSRLTRLRSRRKQLPWCALMPASPE